ncbi:Putative AC transposase [Frankliniella fusca]|uniref:AC transposase n=1 Tax=Frankliniella fusca TaxID=407009 RepID=A0AAE1LVH3_9NEOP|nr:Putative AC transposase [Frankliniella fusca]
MPHEIPRETADALKALEPEDFWVEISTMKDYRDVHKFPNLVKLARLVMTLPHSNAQAEQVFAMVTDTKTKKRNRMGGETLDSICVVRTAMRQKKISCYQYEVTEGHLSKHNKTMYDKQ